MILPTKHLSPDRALISVASDVYGLIGKKSTVSSLWMDLKEKYQMKLRLGVVSYDWFVLSLDLLYVMGLIYWDDNNITKVKG
ncbi:ABC-three component system middle component 6 [Sedimenticola hydrogenitrophicus]|uniref:ABC-three component system middle component 6 n=1 Tax=Sedimenticola hydrogenitrophicus TaxID=2967975 RepID=UPI0023B175C9|nr:ABC-three component system middle component 6 [Sedimenticola hydrogenitrophicus]